MIASILPDYFARVLTACTIWLPHTDILISGRGGHRDCLAIENGCHHLAAAPFYFLFIIGYALPGRHHVVDDDNLFPFDIPYDAVVAPNMRFSPPLAS